MLEKSLLREYAADEVVACFPDDLDEFIGPNTRVVAVSTHNPLGVTFAAGVYTSIYGSSKEPLNSIYSRAMFDKIKSQPVPQEFSRWWWADQVAGRSRKPTPSRNWALTASRRAAASPPTLSRCFQKAIDGRSAATRNQSGSPHLARRHPLSRQAHDVRRRGDDDRVRSPVPVLCARLEPAD